MEGHYPPNSQDVHLSIYGFQQIVSILLNRLKESKPLLLRKFQSTVVTDMKIIR